MLVPVLVILKSGRPNRAAAIERDVERVTLDDNAATLTLSIIYS